ncbi:hypothetical protein IP70_15700 [alpha proteobacterium AAP38]|nr:hypothetical protein IP70_15700 [alpha proteobacterium AAP38]
MKIGPFEISLWKRSEPVYDQWKNPPFFGYMRTAAGLTVSNDSALTHSAVLSCINVIAEGVAMLPLMLYRETGSDEREEAKDHPLYELLLTSPCQHMTAFQFWKRALFDKIAYGNFYAQKILNPDGSLRELLPIDVGHVQPFWYRDPVTALRRRAYRVSLDDGQQAVFLEDEILHLQFMPIQRGVNAGLMGASVWQVYQAETLGGVLATEEFANSSFANGASLSGMVSVEPKLEPEQSKRLREEVNQAYAGQSHKIGVFGGGAKYTPISQTHEQAQLLDTRKYNRSVIGGILRVTAHLINDLERGTFSNVEHLDIAHYKHCLYPHLTDICQTLAKDLLTPSERLNMYVEPDPTILLMGDQATLAEVLEKTVQGGIRTPDEARRVLNLGPKAGGGELFINSASVPVSMAAKGQGASAAQKTGDTNAAA